MKRRRGFTLVEVMIAVSIIGMLAGLATVSFAGSRGGAYRRICYRQQRSLAGAIEAYCFDNALDVQILDSRTMESLVREGYLQRLPRCPDHEEEGAKVFQLKDGQVCCRYHGSLWDAAR